MSGNAQASFACGMPNPWSPYVRPFPATEYPPVIATMPPHCDHCFCIEDATHAGQGKHLQCCKCRTLMAEKFVDAWFKILAPGQPGGET